MKRTNYKGKVTKLETYIDSVIKRGEDRTEEYYKENRHLLEKAIKDSIKNKNNSTKENNNFKNKIKFYVDDVPENEPEKDGTSRGEPKEKYIDK